MSLKIILVNPSLAANIGAVARAMKTMGLHDLTLVNPKQFPHQSATAMAAGADDILSQANVEENLVDALRGCHCVVGVSARNRTLSLPVFDARQAMHKIQHEIVGDTALLFGRESSGLTNEELALCHFQLVIPSNPEFSSLNLAAAVQVVAYEYRMSSLASSTSVEGLNQILTHASTDQLEGFYEQLRQTLIDLHFLNPEQPRRLLTRLRQLFNRANLNVTEVNILRGILTAIQKVTK